MTQDYLKKLTFVQTDNHEAGKYSVKTITTEVMFEYHEKATWFNIVTQAFRVYENDRTRSSYETIMIPWEKVEALHKFTGEYLARTKSEVKP